MELGNLPQGQKDDDLSSGGQGSDPTKGPGRADGGKEKGDDGGSASKGKGKGKAPETNAQKKTARRRTKTGCVTCRKRRIKCDEYHPICHNCKKSKRICEGYNHQPQLIFKQPMMSLHGGPYGPLIYQPGADHYLHGYGSHDMHLNQLRQQQSSLPVIAPKPSLGLEGQLPMPYGPVYIPPNHHHPSASPHSANGFNFVPRPPDGVSPGTGPFPFMTHHAQNTPPPQPYPMGHPYEPPELRTPINSQSSPWSGRGDHFSPGSSSSSQTRPGGPYPGFNENVIPTPSIMDQVFQHVREQPYPLEISQPPASQNSHHQHPQPYSQQFPDIEEDEEEEDFEIIEPEYSEMSEEEFDDAMYIGSEAPHFGMMADIISAHQISPHPRHDTQLALDFAQEMTVAAYVPAVSTDPITDPVTKAVFIHFVNATGPTMSLYERCAFDAPKLAPGIASRSRVASVWTYTFPALALNHPALMQAILALGSLQIATTQRIPPTAAMKHYSRAIRRIAQNVRSPNRRTRPATLAATLLLAYFEVWSSDHSKWCNHLFGARILFREIDLRGMTRAIVPLKRLQRLSRAREQHRPQTSSLFGMFEAEFAFIGDEPDDLALDIDVINELSGGYMTLEDYGLGNDCQVDQDPSSAQANRAIGEYEQLRDLFWWYAKMDVYQSMLGGTKLFMEFEHWTQCPPRGPIGNIDLVYGSYDHLMLLLGRLSSFASKDLTRKTKVFKSQSTPDPSGLSSPMMAGILPPQGKVSAPMGFSPQRDSSPYSEQSEEADAETALAVAMREWTALFEAFEVFKVRLGPLFEPLSAEYADRKTSPFGPPLQYRTFSTAGIWMNYYMGLIFLHRTHPSMPPVAMMAAGQAAKVTAPFAMNIGRIAAGLGDSYRDVAEVNTLIAAALIESCFCLFVAAITYHDLAQRHWMVRRMHDIARLTGWQSARQIADGCESGWIKAYQLGRGPPYERLDMRAEPSSIWANPRRIDRVIRNTPENRLALVRSERTHYALGLLSVENDFEKLELKEEPM